MRRLSPVEELELVKEDLNMALRFLRQLVPITREYLYNMGSGERPKAEALIYAAEAFVDTHDLTFDEL